MKISEKRSQNLYSSIHDNIMDLRVLIKMEGSDIIDSEEVDRKLFLLERSIWTGVKKSLGIVP